MSFITVGDLLQVVSLNQDIKIYDMNGVTLYEGSNSTAPHKFDEAYVNDVWVSENLDELVIEADYDVED